MTPRMKAWVVVIACAVAISAFPMLAVVYGAMAMIVLMVGVFVVVCVCLLILSSVDALEKWFKGERNERQPGDW
ncbi:MAG: hypothetical protein LPL29_07640 [Alphaproteobacteria bacterium]|nr:hypothetical protein [Alphaproteobacteria bacterium]